MVTWLEPARRAGLAPCESFSCILSHYYSYWTKKQRCTHMIRFWGKRNRRSKAIWSWRIGFAYTQLSPYPGLWNGISQHSGTSPSWSWHQELHLGAGGVRSWKFCWTLLSWEPLQKPECQAELREAPKHADVFRDDFRAVSFTQAQNSIGKTFLWLSTSLAHVDTEASESQNPWQNTQTRVFQNSERKNIFFNSGSSVWLVGCLTKLGHKSVQSSGFLWESFFGF